MDWIRSVEGRRLMGQYDDEIAARRQFKGKGFIKCGICLEPLVDHGPPPCPHAIDRITIPYRNRSERSRRRTVEG